MVKGGGVGGEIEDLLPEINEGSGGGGNSVIMVVATDAPLTSRGLQRLARRATLGLAGTGGRAHASSGDIAIAFSTARAFDRTGGAILEIQTIDPRELDPFFDAAAEATEEAIVNFLTMAETTSGFRGNRVYGIPLDRLVRIVR